MKNVLYFILISISFIACDSSKKSLEHGDYYSAVYKSVRALQRNATKEKQILILKEAFPKANAKDLKKINQLKLDGDPQAWDRIYKIYKNLDSRQELVQTVTPLYLNGQEIDFSYKNYQKNMAEAKLRAAQYYYNKAKELMQNDDQISNRKAYENLLKVKSYFSDYEDTEQLLKEAHYLGISHVIISIKNEATYKFSRIYLAELLNFGIGDLNTQWKQFYTNYNQNINYDYQILVKITSIKASDALRETSDYTEEKEIEDGWKYELDEKGNVKKDSLGNDIKTKKFKTIKCKVKKTTQKKSLSIYANIQYINKLTGQIVGNTNINATNRFEHISASAFGDMNALSEKSKNLIKQNPIAFPSNDEMIEELKPILRNKIKNSIKQNREYIK